jgi:DNA polymerase-3 subunit gamma/tau
MLSLLQQIALYQGDPALAEVDDFPLDLLQQYAAAWSAEEIQLYYQIMLQGRHDLLISPDEAAGFEMLMLRLIAFSPAADNVSDSGQLKKKPELNQAPGNGADKPALAAVDSRPLEEPGPEVVASAPTAVDALPDIDLQRDSGSPATENEPPVESTIELVDAGKEAEADVSPAAKAEADSIGRISATETGTSNDAGIDWSGLAYNLGLVGLAQEIVANSTLESWRDGNLKLALLSEIHELINPVIESEIRQALEQKLEVSLQLDLIASKTLPVETPLQAKLRRLEEERLAAIDAIREDSVVRKLQQTLAAELDEQSVVKIDNISK